MRTPYFGRLIATVALALIGTTVGADDKQETKIKLADCPAAVQKTLVREALGAKIEEVEKEVEKGKTSYEAEVKIDNKTYESKVAADGTLISKALEDDEDDKDDEKDDDH